jgi:DNA-binding MarR family transcriptional regulator
MSDDTEILREIRDLLRLIAEPALAKKDERVRISLQELVGKSKQKAEVVVLMDGTRSQTEIRKAAGIDPGNLSRFVTALREAELIGLDEKRPKLVFPEPSNLIDIGGKSKK